MQYFPFFIATIDLLMDGKSGIKGKEKEEKRKKRKLHFSLHHLTPVQVCRIQKVIERTLLSYGSKSMVQSPK